MFSLDFYKKRISHFLSGFIQREDSSYREMGKKFKLSPTSIYRAANERKEITLNDIHVFACELNIPLSTFFNYLEEEKRGMIEYKYPWEGEILEFFSKINPDLRASFIGNLLQLPRKYEDKLVKEYLQALVKIANLPAKELELFVSLLNTLGSKYEKSRSA